MECPPDLIHRSNADLELHHLAHDKFSIQESERKSRIQTGGKSSVHVIRSKQDADK